MRVIDLSTLSLVGGSGIAEAKIPLWWADGTTVSTTSASGAGVAFLADGGGITSSQTASNVKIFTLSSNWSQSKMYALEVTAYTSNSSYSAVFGLYDLTNLGSVGGTITTTNSTTATVVRSANGTLIPGHTYGVTVYSSNSSATAYYTDASLIIFPN